MGDPIRTRHSSLALVLCSLCLLVVAEGCSRATDIPRDVLLITLDTTRADHLGAYGSARARTPHIDALAKTGWLFEQAIAPTPITLPSHASILTGTYPSSHGAHDNGLFVLNDQARLLPEVLHEAGFRTGAFVGSYVLDARFGLDQGFEIYDNASPPTATPGSASANRNAESVVDAALGWLRSLGAEDRFFAWLHFYDPHQPYQHHGDSRAQGLSAYEAEIAYCDTQIGRLLAALEDLDRRRDLLVVITADHGEALGEHGEDTHGVFLYQSTLSVPLILAGPGLGPQPRGRSAAPVSNVAIAATILAALGIDPTLLPAARTRTLFDAAGAAGAADAANPEPLYIESYLPYHSFRWRAYRGLQVGAHKLIEGVRPELYALDRDPDERDDLATQQPETLARMRNALRDTLEAHPPLNWVDGIDVTTEEEAQLEALGYVVGDRGDDPFAATLPDPRLRIRDTEMIDRARRLFDEAVALRRSGSKVDAERNLETAAILLSSVRRNNPRDPEALIRLGAVRAHQGKLAEAASLLEQAVAEQPRKGTGYVNLATVYAQQGHGDKARETALRGLERTPDQASLSLWLLHFHVQRGETEAARAIVARQPEGASLRPVLEAALQQALAGAAG